MKKTHQFVIDAGGALIQHHLQAQLKKRHRYARRQYQAGEVAYELDLVQSFPLCPDVSVAGEFLREMLTKARNILHSHGEGMECRFNMLDTG